MTKPPTNKQFLKNTCKSCDSFNKKDILTKKNIKITLDNFKGRYLRRGIEPRLFTTQPATIIYFYRQSYQAKEPYSGLRQM